VANPFGGRNSVLTWPVRRKPPICRRGKFTVEKRQTNIENRKTEKYEQTNTSKETAMTWAQLAEDARALMAATADVAGEKVGEARKRLAAALESAKEIAGNVRDKAVAGAKAADEAVRENIPIKPSPSASASGRSSAFSSPAGAPATRD
jgi:ElaB/YqjD/DUF883 family membrane-anchored ribosome-binding protein